MVFVVVAVAALAALPNCQAFQAIGINTSPGKSLFQHPSPHAVSRLFQQKDIGRNDRDGDRDAWDADVDYEKEWPAAARSSNPDPTSDWNELSNLADILGEDGNEFINPLSKLGIDVELADITPEQAKKIKEQATKVVNDSVAAGIKDIDDMRAKLKRELEANRQARAFASEMNAKAASEKLTRKIDKLTSDFLQKTKSTRESTKLAAAASKAMEGTGKGLEMGTWGVLDGMSVIADREFEGSSTLLGSVGSVVQKQKRAQDETRLTMDDSDMLLSDNAAAGQRSKEQAELNQGVQVQKNRIVVIADTNQDKVAKQIMPKLIEEFENCDVPNLEVDVISPTSTIPLGGNDAACVLIMCTSLSQPSTLRSVLDKLLRRTLGVGGKLGTPPTQIVAVSTVGTARVAKFPYSMQNLMSGGALAQRKQIEEAVITTVQQREVAPPLDYTIVKVGEIGKGGSDFQLRPGDDIDGGASVDVVAATIVQAVAYQPFARNSTLSIVGSTAPEDAEGWADAFLLLDGPELWRRDLKSNVEKNYGELVEYVSEWAKLLADSGKGLTTPVRMMPGLTEPTMPILPSISQQDGIRLLFLPTSTGKNYVSRQEERDLEGSSSKRSTVTRANAREGGVDVVVEIVEDSRLRIRARRCNYADDAVIKELSEVTILKRLEDAMDVWEREHEQ